MSKQDALTCNRLPKGTLCFRCGQNKSNHARQATCICKVCNNEVDDGHSERVSCGFLVRSANLHMLGMSNDLHHGVAMVACCAEENGSHGHRFESVGPRRLQD
jgi:hypothetical protein